MARDKTPPKKRKSGTKLFLVNNRKYKVFVSTLREIKRLQDSTEFCISKRPFARLIREVIQDVSINARDMKVQQLALSVIQEAAEMYLTQVFEDCGLCASHANRITVRPNDMKLTLRLRAGWNVYNH